MRRSESVTTQKYVCVFVGQEWVRDGRGGGGGVGEGIDRSKDCIQKPESERVNYSFLRCWQGQ